MAENDDMAADEMFPVGEDIELPGERKAKKKGGKGKWIALAVGVGVLGGVGTYVALNKKDVTPANYPAEPIVDTMPAPKPEIPEGLMEKKIESVYPTERIKTQSLSYKKVSDKELSSIMSKYNLAESSREEIRWMSNYINEKLQKKRSYVKHEIIDVHFLEDDLEHGITWDLRVYMDSSWAGKGEWSYTPKASFARINGELQHGGDSL